MPSAQILNNRIQQLEDQLQELKLRQGLLEEELKSVQQENAALRTGIDTCETK